MNCVACGKEHTHPDVLVFIAFSEDGICDDCVVECWRVLADRANQERKVAPLKKED